MALISVRIWCSSLFGTNFLSVGFCLVWRFQLFCFWRYTNLKKTKWCKMHVFFFCYYVHTLCFCSTIGLALPCVQVLTLAWNWSRHSIAALLILHGEYVVLFFARWNYYFNLCKGDSYRLIFPSWVSWFIAAPGIKLCCWWDLIFVLAAASFIVNFFVASVPSLIEGYSHLVIKVGCTLVFLCYYSLFWLLDGFSLIKSSLVTYIVNLFNCFLVTCQSWYGGVNS